MEFKNVERYLNSFGKFIIKQSRTNLTKAKKNVSKELYNSLRYTINVDKKDVTISFYMADYGTFVDKGVSGIKNIQEYRTYDGRIVESPFKYGKGTNPGGLRKGIRNWIKERGLKGRVDKNWKSAGNKGGQFITNKSLEFLIVRKIYTQGIKGISFFQRPMELGLKKFGKQILEAIGKDIRQTITNEF